LIDYLRFYVPLKNIAAALAENKKTILKEFEAKTSALQEKGSSFDFKLEHHKERQIWMGCHQGIQRQPDHRKFRGKSETQTGRGKGEEKEI
jgi:hypothetical protein